MERNVHRRAVDNAVSLRFNRAMLCSRDGSFAVYRLTERVYDTANEGVADRNGEQAADTPHQHAFIHF